VYVNTTYVATAPNAGADHSVRADCILNPRYLIGYLQPFTRWRSSKGRGLALVLPSFLNLFSMLRLWDVKQLGSAA